MHDVLFCIPDYVNTKLNSLYNICMYVVLFRTADLEQVSLGRILFGDGQLEDSCHDHVSICSTVDKMCKIKCPPPPPHTM